jgi:hypothetical protein
LMDPARTLVVGLSVGLRFTSHPSQKREGWGTRTIVLI